MQRTKSQNNLINQSRLFDIILKKENINQFNKEIASRNAATTSLQQNADSNRISISSQNMNNTPISLINQKQKQKHSVSQELIAQMIKQYFPRWDSHELQIKKIFENSLHYEIFRRLITSFDQSEKLLDKLSKKRQNKEEDEDISFPAQRKITRATIAKKNQKVQQQLRKDQIYVRLTPRSSSCMQFMLTNRNFPRIQCKLSCNQHLEYLINYLSNKWIRGKMGYKIFLYPDTTSFLKNQNVNQRQRILHEPLNNFLMFTDVMLGSQVGQNGVLDLVYDIVQINTRDKASKKREREKEKQPQLKQYSMSPEKRTLRNSNRQNKPQDLMKGEAPAILGLNNLANVKMNQPIKTGQKPQNANYNQSSVFPSFKNQYMQDSYFGSLGFNLRSINHHENPILLNLNSNSYLNPDQNYYKANYNNLLSSGGNIIQQTMKQDSLGKIDNLRNAINVMDKQEQVGDQYFSEKSLKLKESIKLENPEFSISETKKEAPIKEVKTIGVIKKKNLDK